ncbi:transmembrane protein 30C [Polymixia lowei]
MGEVRANSGPLARRPDNSAFKQQRLPAWSPMLTANTVLPFFYCMSVLCMLLGVMLLITVQSTRELKMDYTEAGTCNMCFEKRKNVSNAAQACNCIVVFPIEKAIKGDVFFYYGLQNFHQNLRRYMDSRDDGQLVGRKRNLKNPSTYCEPFSRDHNGLPIAPCGAVANSIFNDSFTVMYHGSRGSTVQVPLFRKSITWYTDKNVKYRNPQTTNETLAQVFEGTTQPLFWQKPVYELDPQDSNNNGFINEDLIIWMREAAFPNFKKLYGILNRGGKPFTNGLPVGNYSIHISYNFPVQYFQGRKEVVLTTVTWFGGQNRFLPIAYLVTSGLILLLAVILTVIWWKFGKNGKNMSMSGEDEAQQDADPRTMRSS